MHVRFAVWPLMFMGGCSAGLIPVAPPIRLSPSTPTTQDDLVATVEAPTGGTTDLELVWRRDGAVLPAWMGRERIPATETQRDEDWTVEVRPSGAQGQQGRVTTATTTIVNAGPSAPTLILSPFDPDAFTDLTLGIQATDPDGDVLTPVVTWTVDDQIVGRRSDGLSSKVFVGGQTVAVEVYMDDGRVYGPARIASVDIPNTPPEPPVGARLTPVEARPTQDFTCKVSQPAIDRDGDALTYTYRLLAADAVLSTQRTPATQVVFSRDLVAIGARVQCEVVASDGVRATRPVLSNEARREVGPPRGLSTCGALGARGPTDAELEACYRRAVWSHELSFPGPRGEQIWTAPVTGQWRFRVRGASGGGKHGGEGARVAATLDVEAGTEIRVMVGQTGCSYSSLGSTSGGGGASWIYLDAADEQPLLVAAGGGGGVEYNYLTWSVGGAGSGGTMPSEGEGMPPGPGGQDGGGGAGGQTTTGGASAGGGAGWKTNGGNGTVDASVSSGTAGIGGASPRTVAKGAGSPTWTGEVRAVGSGEEGAQV